jgi:hypothetical protein
MKICLFCGKPPRRNSEHIIAKKLIERMRAETFELCVGKITDGEEPMQRTTQTLKSYVTNHVCETCNHGWMSQLEMWFLRNLGALVEPEWPKLASDFVQIAWRENKQVARWLLKTAITAEQNGMVRGQVIPNWVKPLARTGKLGSNIWVDWGYSKEKSVGLFLTKGFPVHNGEYFFPNQIHKDGFRFTVQLNHFLLCLMHIPEAEPKRRRILKTDSILISPALPYREFANVSDFENTIYLRTWAGKK